MYIKNAKIVKHPVVEVQTEDLVYTINFSEIQNEEFDVLKQDKNFFFDNFKFNQWMIFWDESTDVSIDELESCSRGNVRVIS